MKSGLLNNEYKLYSNGAFGDIADNGQAYHPSSSRSPIYRNRFMPKFHGKQQDGVTRDQQGRIVVSKARMA